MSADPRHHLGRLGERLAEEHFARLGFRTLARNHRTRFGELDLVVFDGRTLVFAEVKTRRAGARGANSPWDSLHERKRRQVRRMARAYLADAPTRPAAREIRLDAVGVVIDAYGRLTRLDHLEAAF